MAENKFKRWAYRKEVIWILIIKVLFLSLIWYVCFRHPLGDHLNDRAVVGHLVAGEPSKSNQ